MTTMRERLEQIRDASCEEYQSPDSAPSFKVIRQIYSEAEACIAILDAADWQYDQQRLIPDPKK